MNVRVQYQLCLFLPVLPEGKAVASATSEDEDEEGYDNCTVACNEDKREQETEELVDICKNKEHHLSIQSVTTSTHPSTHSPLVTLTGPASKEAPQVVVLGNFTCSWLPG